MIDLVLIAVVFRVFRKIGIFAITAISVIKFLFAMDYCKITKMPTYTLVEILVERLDIQVATPLKSDLVQLNGNREKNIVLDLSNCSYCDSSGLSAILVANRLCKNSGGVFVLCGLQESVDRLITISQLESVLNIVANKEKADEFLQND